jgi:hypothetical protein
MTITLQPQGGQTALTWRMLFLSAADCDKVKRLAVEANEQNLDRLDAELSRLA